MENNNPYERKQKSQAELYQEKIQKRNETEEWIFGNSFNKSGNGAPMRDNQGNIISYQKAYMNNNSIYTQNDYIYDNVKNDLVRFNSNRTLSSPYIINISIEAFSSIIFSLINIFLNVKTFNIIFFITSEILLG